MHIIKHFITITRHRHKVIKLCFKVGIGLLGLRHDLSKYTPIEFFLGAKYYQGDKSPHAKERELYGYSKAWLHHKGRNKHHFEYWCEYEPSLKAYKAIKMPFKYLKEMFCDRVAATKIYMGKNYTPQGVIDYYNFHKDIYVIHEETNKVLLSWFDLLLNHSEKEALKIIRKQKNY